MRLQDKVVLVTGSARGIGEAAARRIAEEGGKVIVSDVLHDLGKAVAADIGVSALYCPLDVRSEADWERAIALGTREFGPITGLVNNAAISRHGELESTTRDQYMEVIEVNQVGVFLGMRAVIPAMKEAGGGSIVNVSSPLGQTAMDFLTAYVASKFAVRGMTQVAAMELGAYGIRVNTLLPGMVPTPLLLPEHGSPQHTDRDRMVAEMMPLGRRGTADEVARVIAFLLSDDSAYCTGADFAVEGGLLAGIRPPKRVAAEHSDGK